MCDLVCCHCCHRCVVGTCWRRCVSCCVVEKTSSDVHGCSIKNDICCRTLITSLGVSSRLRFKLMQNLCVVQDSGACLLFVHVCRTVDRVVGRPRHSLAGIGVRVSLRGPRCALMPRVASRQSANPLWLLKCGLVNVSWRSKQDQRDCTLLLLDVFRV